MEARLSATPISLQGTETFATAQEQVTGGQPITEWLKRLLNEEDEIARMNGFMRLLDTLGTDGEIEQALDAVLTGNLNWARGKEFSMLLQKWAQLDPKNAMAYLEKQKDQNAKFAGYRAVLPTWTRRNAQEAVAWAETNGAAKDERDGNWAMATIVSQLSKTDPDWALRLTQGQTMSRARGRMIEAVIGQFVSQRGDEAAREMVMSVPEETLRNGMIARLVEQLANDNPASAAQWIATIPAGEGRQRALSELVDEWSEKDPAAAATYLAQYPASPDTDESRGRLAKNVLRNDPEGALAWANTISEPDYRTRTVADLVRSWMKRDTDAAQKWVLSSQLANDVKQKLIATPRDGDRNNL
jgi:hypothetical protein